MDKYQLEERTKQFALRIITFVGDLPHNQVTSVLGYQLLKAGTSIGANYREANRASSANDFIHKLSIVEKECSESVYWLELCHESQIGAETERQAPLQEANELLAIFTAAGRTAKRNRK